MPSPDLADLGWKRLYFYLQKSLREREASSFLRISYIAEEIYQERNEIRKYLPFFPHACNSRSRRNEFFGGHTSVLTSWFYYIASARLFSTYYDYWLLMPGRMILKLLCTRKEVKELSRENSRVAKKRIKKGVARCWKNKLKNKILSCFFLLDLFRLQV